MYVCKRCHDRDIKVTKCMTPFNYHSNHIKSKCDVCGKIGMVAECWAYNYIERTEKLKCLYARSVTHGTEK